MRSLTSRAELLKIAVTLGREAMLESAQGLGYEPETPRHEPAGPSSDSSARPFHQSSTRPVPQEEPPIPFWQPLTIEIYDEVDQRALLQQVEAREATAEAQLPWQGGEDPPPSTPPLSPWRRTGPLLQRALSDARVGRRLDLRTLLRRWCRGVHLQRLPRRSCRTWVSAHVLVDRSTRLAPFWDDQDGLVRELRGVLGRSGLFVHILPEGLDNESTVAPWARAGAPVLALTDLGWYGGDDERRAWLRVGRELTRARVALHALVPVPPARWSDALAHIWRVMPWERPTPAAQVRLEPQTLEVRVTRLLRLLGPAMRIEPGLLRVLRLQIPRDKADAGTEADLWGRPELGPPFPEYRTLLPEFADEQRRAFLRDRDADHKTVIALLRAWHWNTARQPEAWHLEVLALAEAHAQVMQGSSPLPLDAADLQRAQAFMSWVAGDLRAQALAGIPEDHAAALRVWCRFVGEQEPRLWSSATQVGEALQIIAQAVGGVAVPGLDPRLGELVRPAEPLQPPREYWLRQIGAVIGVTTGAPDEPGSPVAVVVARRPALYVGSDPTSLPLDRQGRRVLPPSASIELRTDRSTLVLAPLTSPSWAQEIGRDAHGLWAELAFISYRLRWIPPGRFYMGSPEDEPGRDDDEGPRHLVTITQGFWLGETPVTQALWQAVTGKNPSRFKTPDRPVEQVSWEDCHRMLARLNRASPASEGGFFRLPTEAEWEYACRAGTSTATYAGPIEIVGENSAPILSEISWYGGNSGISSDLAKGNKTSSSTTKQHGHDKAGTQCVGQKLPNQWGLQDMLGNVWEWCSDWYGAYSNAALRDPVGPPAGSGRVMRGSAWNGRVQFVRAACRLHDRVGRRSASLGFRLVRDQGSGDSRPRLLRLGLSP